METETKICQNCQKELTIEPEDFAFYEKIHVPPPTFCPECRLIRRMVWRNERNLYKRKCDLCQNDFISVHSLKESFPAYCPNCYYSDKWDAMVFGAAYDFSTTFFEQFRVLSSKVPKLGINNIASRSVNSEYTNYALDNKNCYLTVSAWENENVIYTTRAHQDNDLADCYNVFNSSLCYQCVDCQKGYGLFFSQQCENCLNSILLFDCRNCNDCIACAGIRNQNLFFLNEPASKEKINDLKEKIRTNQEFRNEIFQKFRELKNNIPHKFSNLLRVNDCRGDNLINCKRCVDCFELQDSENCRFVIIGGKVKDEYDVLYDDISELLYEVMSGQESYRCAFNIRVWYDNNIFYSKDIESSQNLFGCVGLRNKEYCILNKQYTKQEYEALVPKIIRHMNEMPYADKKGRVYKYGEFFPPELSPFCYNETIAQEYFPLTKEQALDQGYSWKDPEERNLKLDFKPQDLPDHIKDVSDSIIGKIIECANAKSSQGIDPGKTYRGLTPGESGEFSNCTTAFKIISQELAFYRKMNLPLPRLCPNCRHYERLKQRNPLKLWRRKCMCNGKTSGGQPSVKFQEGSPPEIYTNTVEHFHKDKPCPQEFETTYAPDRLEIVYCEECYKREVN